jgi:anti-sigma regulatory factor (Ser/Thr protein kinase)
MGKTALLERLCLAHPQAIRFTPRPGEEAVAALAALLLGAVARGFPAGRRDEDPLALARSLAESPRDGNGRCRWGALAGLATLVDRREAAGAVVVVDSLEGLPDHGDFLAAASAGTATWVVAADHPPAWGVPPPGRVVVIPLEPLADGEARALLREACGRARIVVADGALEAVPLLGGIPGLLEGMALAAAGGPPLDSADALIHLYAGEMLGGFLEEHYLGRLTRGVGPGESRALLEVLMHLASRGGAPVEATVLAGEMLKDEERVTRAVELLSQRDLVRRRWGMVSSAPCRPLLDFARTQWRRHLEGSSPEECRARLVLESRHFLRVHQAAAATRRNALQLREFMRSWEGRTVPRSLVDARRFRELFEQGQTGRERLLEADRSRLVLPRLADAWPETFPGDPRTPPYRFDLLALGEQGAVGARKWLPVDLRLETAQVTREEVLDLGRRLEILQNRLALSPGELTGWIISGGGFSTDALDAAREKRIWTSGPAQLSLMAEILQPDRTLQFLRPPAARGEECRLVMVIPSRAEIELVAARALEEFGAKLPFAEGDLARVRAALVEACLNALEHGGGEDRSVELSFTATAEALALEVFNRGRAFVGGGAAMPRVEEKFGQARKRGWGIPLMERLMDEVEFLEEAGGTRLRMIKYYRSGTKEADHG